jgi:arsenate reductase
MIRIYHNPRCRKSREGLKYLVEKGLEFECIEYLKNPITEKELRTIIAKMNIRPLELVRTKEAIYKKQFRGKNFTDDEWIKIIIQYPALLKRPVVVKDYKAVVAVPPEIMDVLFTKRIQLSEIKS